MKDREENITWTIELILCGNQELEIMSSHCLESLCAILIFVFGSYMNLCLVQNVYNVIMRTI